MSMSLSESGRMRQLEERVAVLERLIKPAAATSVQFAEPALELVDIPGGGVGLRARTAIANPAELSAELEAMILDATKAEPFADVIARYEAKPAPAKRAARR